MEIRTQKVGKSENQKIGKHYNKLMRELLYKSSVGFLLERKKRKEKQGKEKKKERQERQGKEKKKNDRKVKKRNNQKTVFKPFSTLATEFQAFPPIFWGKRVSHDPGNLVKLYEIL